MRVLGLGDNTVDTYVDRGEQYPGGNAVNVAVMMQRLGAQADYCGCIGNDEAGDIVREALQAEHVGLRLSRHCAAPNARAFIAHNQGDRRFIRSEAGCRGDWGEFSETEEQAIGSFDLVHSSIFSGLESYRDQLRAAIRRWSFDFSEKWNRENLAMWLPSLDYAFLSHPHGTDEDAQNLARHCASYGPDTIVITRGRQAALAWHNGCGVWHTPAALDIVDTLGAGDGLIAAFLFTHWQGGTIDAALAAGMDNAARVCSAFGAFGHGRPWRDDAAGLRQ